MSYKETIIKINNFESVLPGKGVPATIFMNEKLINDSEELLWNEVMFIKQFPGVVRVVVTPDAHASGNGIPVGVVVETDGSTIIPCAAGYDISCGMAAVQTNLTREDIKYDPIVRDWMNEVIKRVSIGTGKNNAPLRKSYRSFNDILINGAYAITHYKEILNNLERTSLPVDVSQVPFIEKAQRGQGQIGSLGGGNHFLEMDYDEHGKVWILIHTGSRGYGHGTAEYFFEKGAELLNLQRKDKEKCWFGTETRIGKEYINSMNAAANFAIANRLSIFHAIEEATNEVFKKDCNLFYEISHNLVQEEDGKLVHRKGATRALPKGHKLLQGSKWASTGHPILIPGSMGTSSAILFAEDSYKSIHSINHGCGRVLSRNKAKKELLSLQEDINDEMNMMNILINTRNTPLDECAYAYKSIDEILNSVEGAKLAKVTASLRPRAVIKGTD